MSQIIFTTATTKGEALTGINGMFTEVYSTLSNLGQDLTTAQGAIIAAQSTADSAATAAATAQTSAEGAQSTADSAVAGLDGKQPLADNLTGISTVDISDGNNGFLLFGNQGNWGATKFPFPGDASTHSLQQIAGFLEAVSLVDPAFGVPGFYVQNGGFVLTATFTGITFAGPDSDGPLTFRNTIGAASAADVATAQATADGAATSANNALSGVDGANADISTINSNLNPILGVGSNGFVFRDEGGVWTTYTIVPAGTCGQVFSTFQDIPTAASSGALIFNSGTSRAEVFTPLSVSGSAVSGADTIDLAQLQTFIDSITSILQSAKIIA